MGESSLSGVQAGDGIERGVSGGVGGDATGRGVGVRTGDGVGVAVGVAVGLGVGVGAAQFSLPMVINVPGELWLLYSVPTQPP